MMPNKKIHFALLLIFLSAGAILLSPALIQNRVAVSSYTFLSLQNLYETESLLKPVSWNTVIALGNPFEVLKFILYSGLGEIYALNFFAILLFAASAFGAYYLVLNFIHRRWIAAVTGLVYALILTSFLYVEIVTILPYLALALFRILEIPSNKRFLTLIILFLLIVQLELQWILFTQILVGTFLIYFWIKHWAYREKRFLWWSFFILALLFAMPALKSEKPPILSDPSALNTSSIDFAEFLIPSHWSFWQERWPLHPSFSTNKESDLASAYLGILFLAVVFYGVSKTKNQNHVFLKYLALIFLLFSLGPFLKIAGVVKPMIPSFYLLLYRFIPHFDRIDSLREIFPFSLLPLVILFGIGLDSFHEWAKTRRKQWISTVSVVILLLNFFQIPRTTPFLKPSSFSHLLDSPEQYNILVFTSRKKTSTELTQTYFSTRKMEGKRIVNIVIDPPTGNENQEIINPILYFEDQKQRKFISTDIEKEFYATMNRHNIRFLLIDQNGFRNDFSSLKKLDSILKGQFQLSNGQTDDNLEIFKVETKKQRITMMEKDGWTDGDIYRSEVDDIEKTSKWSSWTSSLEIRNDSNNEKSVVLEFFVSAEKGYRLLETWRENEKLRSDVIGPGEQGIRILLESLPPGKTMLYFKTPKRYLGDLKEEEPRIKFREVYYTEDIRKLYFSSLYKQILANKDSGVIWQIPILSFVYEEKDKMFHTDRLLDFLKETNDPVAIRDFNLDRINLCTLKPLLHRGIDWDNVEINYDLFRRESMNSCGEHLLSILGIHYSILEKKYLPGGLENYKTYFQFVFPSTRFVEENEKYTLYEHPLITKQDVLVTLIDNFGPLIYTEEGLKNATMKSPQRQVLDGATIEILNLLDRPINKVIRFRMISESGDANVTVKLNEQTISRYLFSTSPQQIELRLSNLKPGSNILEFQKETSSILVMTDLGF